MAYKLTSRTKDSLARELIEPNLILLIDGYPTKLSVKVSNIELRYDIPGLTYDSGLFYDGVTPDPDSISYISITGTSSSIAQQLEPDKGAASSTQTLTLKLIDTNEDITRLITPGLVFDDLMYKGARVFFGLADTAFEDYIEILNGNVMGINPGSGTIDLVVTHPDDIKRSKIFNKIETNVATAVDFDSRTIQNLFYQKRPDVVGTVTVQYTTAGIGDNANVSVTGNDITVQIDAAFTTAKTIKKKLENNEDANQLVTVKISGVGTTVQAAQSQVSLSSSSTVQVENVSGFLLPVAPYFRTFIRIGDEIIEYTGINTGTNTFTGCTRQSLTSFGSTHAVGDQVSSFYSLGDSSFDNGNAIDLALRVLISTSEPIYLEQLVSHVNEIPDTGFIQDSLFLPNIYLIRDYGTVSGDLVSFLSGANTFTDQPISSVFENSSGSYVVFNGLNLVTEVGIGSNAQFKSQYNVLPDGAGLKPSQVDIAQFRYIQNLHSTAIANYEFYLKDTVDVKEFINTQVFLPSALYSLPRKGRVSVGITAPPLYSTETQAMNLTTLKDPKGLRLQRSINKNFYNSIVYQYNPDSVEDKFLNKVITVSADSTNRIDAPSKIFVLKADGLRPSPDTVALIERNSSRFLDRYKFGAESIKIETLFSIGFPIEVGDSVLFGDPFLYLSDTTKGTKDFSPRIMEVINKEWNWVKGDISLTLLDTTYSNSFRYGVFSPSSLVGTGSTSTSISILASFGTEFPVKEKDKWFNYIGKEILVHSEDWSVQGMTYIQGFDPTNDNKMLVFPALGFTPGAGYIVDIVRYEEIDTLDNFYRNVHCYFDPEVLIDNGVSSTQFNVVAGEGVKFFEGSLIRVHNYDYTVDSGRTPVKVTAVNTDQITCEELGFTPDNTMTVEFVGFSFDEGKPYAYI